MADPLLRELVLADVTAIYILEAERRDLTRGCSFLLILSQFPYFLACSIRYDFSIPHLVYWVIANAIRCINFSITSRAASIARTKTYQDGALSLVIYVGKSD